MRPEQYLPWSFSKMMMAQQCSRACYLACSGTVAEKDRAEKPFQTSQGLFIHSALEARLLQEKWKTATDEEKQYLKKDIDAIKPPPEVDPTHLSALLKNCDSFITKDLPACKKLLDWKHPDRVIVCSEVKLGITNDYKPAAAYPNRFFGGILDLLLIARPDAIIVDYKTDRAFHWHIETQLQLYALLVNYAAFPLRKIARATFFVDSNSLEFFEPVHIFEDYPRIDGPSKILLKENIQLASQNLASIRATPGAYCQFCDFRNTCSSKY